MDLKIQTHKLLTINFKMEKSYNKSSDKISWRFLQVTILMKILQASIHFYLSGKNGKWIICTTTFILQEILLIKTIYYLDKMMIHMEDLKLKILT